MYNENHISMWFGLCKCWMCKNKHRRKIRQSEYRRITKKLRQAKHKSELPHDILNTMKYTD